MTREDHLTHRLVGKVSALEEAVIQLEQASKELEARVGEAFSRISRFEASFREAVAGEAKGVFQSFNKTATSILGEMKSELVKGLGRIQEIEALVSGKAKAEERLPGGEEIMGALLASGAASDSQSLDEDEETRTDIDVQTERHPQDSVRTGIETSAPRSDEEPSSDDILADLGRGGKRDGLKDKDDSGFLDELAPAQENAKIRKPATGSAKQERK